MFQEPIEDRYNALLKQRIALEGELALARQKAETDLAKARSKNKRYLFLLLLLPLLTFWWTKKKYIEPLEQHVSAQQIAIHELNQSIASIKKVKKESIQYVVKKGDMLVSLGKLFFNDTLAGYQIGVDNGLKTDYEHRHLRTGDTLTIYYSQQSPTAPENPPPQLVPIYRE